MIIHNSGISAFKECRRKWQLRNKYQPIKINDNLFLGSGVHYALEKYYAENDNLQEAFIEWFNNKLDELDIWDEQMEMLEEKKKLGLGMLKHYQKFADNNDSDYFTKVVDTEIDFEIPVKNLKGNTTHCRYAGTVDGLVIDEFGLYWILEHKTASRIDTSHLPLDEQVARYMWAMQEKLGIEISGVIYNILLKKIPTEPRVLKSGHLSKAKNIKTTYATYLNSLINYYGSFEEIPLNDYSDILGYLQGEENEFFKRVKVEKTQHEIDDIAKRTYLEYKEMSNPNLRMFPAPSRDCNWKCDFREVCISMNQGHDYDYLLEKGFKKI
jgi:CRISPR/Cas system-associated exonuclease Cas4 (RecB family)